MNTLFAQLSERHARGHARTDIRLHQDTRIPEQQVETFRPAAVLACITEREQPGLLLIHRPSNMRAHPGQIAFPGGKLDPGETAIQAALREAYEELGIEARDVQVVGASDQYRTGSGFDITPVVSLVPSDLCLRPNPLEVAQWFEAPLDHVFDPANQHEQWTEFEGAMHRYWQIVWKDHDIWGVTAGIIVNISRRLGYHD